MAGIQVNFKELGVREGDSPTLSASLDTTSLTRRLLLNWDDAFAGAAQLLGWSEVASGFIGRHLPQEDFELPGLWASQVGRLNGLAWQGKVDSPTGFGSTNEFKKAVLEVQFLPRPYLVLGDGDIDDGEGGRNEFLRFVEVETALEGEYLTVPTTGLLHWSEGPNGPEHDDGPLPFPGNIGKIVNYANYLFRWHQVPLAALPEATILDVTGRVNQTAFGNPDDPTGQRYFPDPGTLLMLGAAWRMSYMLTPVAVVAAWTVEYLMKYRATPWNNFLDMHSTPLAFYQVTKDGEPQTPGEIEDGMCVYDEREFADLFEPAS